MKVRKAVIPAAGFGTRFLPASRSIPKVMMPVLDRPVIHYAVEEAVQAGIEHIVIVISHGQEAIKRYFGRVPELERALADRGHFTILNQMLEISEWSKISYVYQEQQLGLGHAVFAARAVVGNEPFAVFLPDDLIFGDAPTIGDMIKVFSEHQGSVLAVNEVPDEMIPSLGIVDSKTINETVSEVVGLVEKPSLDEAPTNLAIVGRYVLTPEVFDALEKLQPGVLGEFQLTDAIATLLSSQRAYAYCFPGVHFDVGTPLGLLKASVYAGMRRDDLEGAFRRWVAEIL